MVLNVKAMEWASSMGLDSAKLKAAKVKIFGKWYFPDIPANERLVNLQTGEVETFPRSMRAGTVLYALEDELQRAKLGPYADPPADASTPTAESPSPASQS